MPKTIRGRWYFKPWIIVALFTLLAFLLTVAFIGHGVVTGIGVPYQDPTPEQAEYERYHRSISTALFSAQSLVWLIALIFAIARGLFAIVGYSKSGSRRTTPEGDIS